MLFAVDICAVDDEKDRRLDVFRRRSGYWVLRFCYWMIVLTVAR